MNTELKIKFSDFGPQNRRKYFPAIHLDIGLVTRIYKMFTTLNSKL